MIGFADVFALVFGAAFVAALSGETRRIWRRQSMRRAALRRLIAAGQCPTCYRVRPGRGGQ